MTERFQTGADALGQVHLTRVLRSIVGLHTFVLLCLPKTSFSLTALRPEDFTGAIVIAAAFWTGVSTRFASPASRLAAAIAAYFGYFLIVLSCQDLSIGQPLSVVIWAKETGYVAYGYLVWHAYRGADLPRLLVFATLCTIPNLVFGTLQLLIQPTGLYGIAPFGHERSPASAGMIYLGMTWIWLARSLFAGASLWTWSWLSVSFLLLVASGSKTATLGGIAFLGWFLTLRMVRLRDRLSGVLLTAFILLGAAGMWVVTSLPVLGITSRSLSRYVKFLRPIETLADRGIWWRVDWIDGPAALLFGSGYSVGRLSADGSFNLGMSMDNQLLYLVITGGVIGGAVAALLLAVVYRLIRPDSQEGVMLRSLVVAYVAMGLGAEVMQLSIHGNVLWLMVAVCLTQATRQRLVLPSEPQPDFPWRGGFST